MNRRIIKMVAGAGAALATAGLMLGQAGSASAATPPWEPDGSSVGGLVFYNSAGAQITGGNVSDAPIAAYVQGTHAVRAGDTKASLYGYLPKNGIAPGAWSGEVLGGPSVYPNSSAPGALGTSALPLETGSNIDLSVANLAADFPNTATDAYAGLYELRLLTTQSGQPANSTYDSADIQVTGSTWSVVYPAVSLASTTTTLTTTQTSPQVAGTSIQLNAAISPAVPGTVQFKDGSTNIGSAVTVSAGAASISTTTLSAGAHTLNAVFTPAQFVAYSGSSGQAPFTISAPAAASTTTALSVNPTTAPADTPVTLTANVTSGGSALSSGDGSVKFFDNGSTLLGTGSLGSGGAASVVYTAFSQGAHSITAQFVPSVPANFATSTSLPIAFQATAPQFAPDDQDAKVAIPAGTLTITSPYTPSHPFDLGTATLDPSDAKFVASGAFGSQSTGDTGNDGGVTITDTRAGGLSWTASATVTDFSDGNTPADTINGENLAFDGVTAVQIQGNALQASAVHTTDITSAATAGSPYSASDPGSDGLKGGPHEFATVSDGAGEVDIDGILTLDAPTSTPAGTYTATLTFTIA